MNKKTELTGVVLKFLLLTALMLAGFFLNYLEYNSQY